MAQVGCSMAAAAAGAFSMYLLDPAQGRYRRSMLRDQCGAAWRTAWRSLGRTARGAAATSYGLGMRATHLQPEEWSVPDDATLARRVESQLFRDPDIPKGRISINAEAGIIVLRGELDSPRQIRDIEDAVGRMAGVRGVHNLLHLVGTPVPDRGSVVPAP